jgi:hypothetical protein
MYIAMADPKPTIAVVRHEEGRCERTPYPRMATLRSPSIAVGHLRRCSWPDRDRDRDRDHDCDQPAAGISEEDGCFEPLHFQGLGACAHTHPMRHRAGHH